jgi:hypothetical protein
MAILSKGVNFQDGDQVTSSNLDNLVDNATFVSGGSGTTDDTSLEVTGAGRLAIKDLGVSSGKIASSAVTTAKIASATGTSDGVTFAKIRQLENMKTIGNVSGSTAAPTQVDILDEDDMSSDSATSLATQQSIKAYVDTGGGHTPSAYAGEESVTFPNGLIMKCGKLSTPTGATNDQHTLTFETAFPNALMSINLTPLNVSGTVELDVIPQIWGNPTNSAVVFRLEDNNSCAFTYWTAWGY